VADIFPKKKRSQIMAQIKSKSGLENKFCQALSQSFYKKGFRYRRNYKKLPGSPDVVFVGRKLAIFIDGDFWHGYTWSHKNKKLPRKYWLAKIKNNMRRDRQNKAALQKLGWTVLRFWEHQFLKNPEKVIRAIAKFL
jgi:DNA mismatch endonuclease (patch repair protein)